MGDVALRIVVKTPLLGKEDFDGYQKFCICSKRILEYTATFAVFGKVQATVDNCWVTAMSHCNCSDYLLHSTRHACRNSACETSTECHSASPSVKHCECSSCRSVVQKHCSCSTCQPKPQHCDCKYCRSARRRRSSRRTRSDDVTGNVVVRFRSQWGNSRQVQLDPPTFEELKRYVRVHFKVKNPRLFHGDELGYVYPIETRQDFEHAVRVTGADRYLTVIINYEEKLSRDYCHCCGRSDPRRRSSKAPVSPILEHDNLPPGLRARLVRPPPFRTWEERYIPDLPKKKKRPFTPKLKVFLQDPYRYDF